MVLFGWKTKANHVPMNMNYSNVEHVSIFFMEVSISNNKYNGNVYAWRFNELSMSLKMNWGIDICVNRSVYFH